MTSAQNDNRPAEFDARVMAYLPGLRNLAARLVKFPVKREDVDDLVNDTVLYALENWKKFRADGGMWNWLRFSMRSISQRKRGLRKKSQTRLVSIDASPNGFGLAVDGGQEEAAELALLEKHIDDLPEQQKTVLRMRLDGHTFIEIAEVIGKVRQRAQQLETAAVTALREAAA